VSLRKMWRKASERIFEGAIEAWLLEHGGYRQGDPHAFDIALGIDPGEGAGVRPRDAGGRLDEPCRAARRRGGGGGELPPPAREGARRAGHSGRPPARRQGPRRRDQACILQAGARADARARRALRGEPAPARAPVPVRGRRQDDRPRAPPERDPGHDCGAQEPADRPERRARGRPVPAGPRPEDRHPRPQGGRALRGRPGDRPTAR
jgi:hypothetical protein